MIKSDMCTNSVCINNAHPIRTLEQILSKIIRFVMQGVLIIQVFFLSLRNYFFTFHNFCDYLCIIIKQYKYFCYV